MPGWKPSGATSVSGRNALGIPLPDRPAHEGQPANRCELVMRFGLVQRLQLVAAPRSVETSMDFDVNVDARAQAERRSSFTYPRLLDLQPVAARKVVLVVEDEPLMLGLLTYILGSENYELIAADRPSKALELVDGGLAPDLLITDLVMPEMTGVELSQRVRARDPGATGPLRNGTQFGALRQGSGTRSQHRLHREALQCPRPDRSRAAGDVRDVQSRSGALLRRLLRSQRDDRIDAGGALGGHQRGDDADHHHDRRHRAERARIVLISHRRGASSSRAPAPRRAPGPAPRRPASASVPRPRSCRSTPPDGRAERHADADLAHALAHRVGEHAVDADAAPAPAPAARTPPAACIANGRCPSDSSTTSSIVAMSSTGCSDRRPHGADHRARHARSDRPRCAPRGSSRRSANCAAGA